jgi:excinuclease ABC subunit B
LIQTIGRAARNAQGKVILYADKVTDSMRVAMEETARRRAVQNAYNQEHGIVPKTIVKEVRELLDLGQKQDASSEKKGKNKNQPKAPVPAGVSIPELEKQMYQAAEALDFERAAELRDRIRMLEKSEK